MSVILRKKHSENTDLIHIVFVYKSHFKLVSESCFIHYLTTAVIGLFFIEFKNKISGGRSD